MSFSLRLRHLDDSHNFPYLLLTDSNFQITYFDFQICVSARVPPHVMPLPHVIIPRLVSNRRIRTAFVTNQRIQSVSRALLLVHRDSTSMCRLRHKEPSLVGSGGSGRLRVQVTFELGVGVRTNDRM